ncbi:hypothetical protein GA0115237_1091107 [Streptomyces sp. ScaeMP-6W]|nr:hypothetical protein [Streptomyces sp. ScaeMP-6W]SCE08725.1 hypothetical protein GA0115237_1091107 [Streptomyces sp. ScaeMP-6W]
MIRRALTVTAKARPVVLRPRDRPAAVRDHRDVFARSTPPTPEDR